MWKWIKMAKQKNKWINHYKDRVNNFQYEEYFKDKYSTLLHCIVDIVTNYNISTIKEEGGGIGTVSKLLLNQFPASLVDKKILYTDHSKDMMSLAHKNLSSLKFSKIPDRAMKLENITSKDKYFPNNCIVVTHGVLEHFSDRSIEKILGTYNNKNVKAHIHYVPTDIYKEKSIGTERLLSLNDWVKLFNPDYYILSIDEKDLILVKINNE